jgi:hypothetical protein
VVRSFGALTYTTSPPTGLLGVGLGGDSTPRMIAFQLLLEFYRLPIARRYQKSQVEPIVRSLLIAVANSRCTT